MATENARLKRQLPEQTEELAILKKRPTTPRRLKIARYRFMHKQSHRFAVLRMAIVLGVSRRGFYRWAADAPQPQPYRSVSATTELKLSEQRYSVRRVQAELASQGERYDVKTIGAIMQRQSLVPKAARKFKVTVDSNHGLPVSLNLLEQNRER
ncbi:hypothetical protein [Vreelandella piezotolerans]|uniref:hypothetical protein n=2 Tax=Halomonadaceae TaxID=28256 RepID=UPI00129C636B|nr:hypothetical protein [Halomonas piezotolerans]QJA22974.1 hypothetical protein GYM47_02050 [Halomonas piezotolerans]